jgi:threonyl-tRNA synthetase
VQVAILPISDAHHDFASEVNKTLKALDIRTELHLESESLGKKIRNAKVAKIPYTLVIGDAEVAAKEVTLESRDKGKIGQFSLEKLITLLQKEITGKE